MGETRFRRTYPFITGLLLLLPLGASGDVPYCAAPAGPVWLPPPKIGDVVLSDYNMRIAPECAHFAPTDSKDSYFGFVSATREMLTVGMACLRKQGLGGLADNLRAKLKPGATAVPIRLACGDLKDHRQVTVNGAVADVTAIAAAVLPGDAGYPAVIFNLDWIRKVSVKSFKSAFFHELLHTIGYDHAKGVDYPYLASGCCFEGSTNACDLLKRSIGQNETWWTTENYLKDAIAWFAGRNDDAMKLIRAAALASPGNLRGVLAGILQLAKNGSLDETAIKELSARCLAAGGGDACKKAFPVHP